MSHSRRFANSVGRILVESVCASYVSPVRPARGSVRRSRTRGAGCEFCSETIDLAPTSMEAKRMPNAKRTTKPITVRLTREEAQRLRVGSAERGYPEWSDGIDRQERHSKAGAENTGVGLRPRSVSASPAPIPQVMASRSVSAKSVRHMNTSEQRLYCTFSVTALPGRSRYVSRTEAALPRSVGRHAHIHLVQTRKTLSVAKEQQLRHLPANRDLRGGIKLPSISPVQKFSRPLRPPPGSPRLRPAACSHAGSRLVPAPVPVPSAALEQPGRMAVDRTPRWKSCLP